LFSEPLKSAMSASDRLARLLVFAGAAAAVFAITTPQVALDFGEFWEFMMTQKSNWYDKAPTTLSGIIAAWFDGTSLAVGILVTATFLIGLVMLAKSRPGETLLLGLCVGANYLFWRGYLPTRFVIVIAPLLCVFSAALWQRLLANSRVWVRHGSAVLLVVAVASSSVICVLGIAQRWLDARTVAARYIAEHVPPGSTIGIATDHNGHWAHHNWRYPRINFAMLSERNFLDDPEYIVVTSLELDRMRQALRSGHLLAGDRWDPRFNRQWYHDDPPAP